MRGNELREALFSGQPMPSCAALRQRLRQRGRGVSCCRLTSRSRPLGQSMPGRSPTMVSSMVTVHGLGTGSFFGPFRAEKWACPQPAQGDSPRELFRLRERWFCAFRKPPIAIKASRPSSLPNPKKACYSLGLRRTGGFRRRLGKRPKARFGYRRPWLRAYKE